MIIKTDIPKTVGRQIVKVLNELYLLEDITEYNNKELGKIIDTFQNIKIKVV